MPKHREPRASSPPTTTVSPSSGARVPTEAPPLASARWLLGFVLAVCALALVCVYAAICLLYWQGQWQFVFPPQQRSKQTAAPSRQAAAPPHQDVGFDSTDTGALQLQGWWIPAAGAGAHSAGTILFLHGGAESLAQMGGELQALHGLGVNVFAFDYRGFGKSEPLHPSEESVAEDSDAAWLYLTGTRHIAPGSIVIYGRRLGAAIAAEAALRHPRCAGMVLESAQPPLLDRLRSRGLNRFLPLSVIFHDRFDPSAALARSSVPKLFLSATGEGSAGGSSSAAPLYFAGAAEPKTSVTLASPKGIPPHSDPEYAAAIGRFLREHLSSE